MSLNKWTNIFRLQFSICILAGILEYQQHKSYWIWQRVWFSRKGYLCPYWVFLPLYFSGVLWRQFIAESYSARFSGISITNLHNLLYTLNCLSYLGSALCTAAKRFVWRCLWLRRVYNSTHLVGAFRNLYIGADYDFWSFHDDGHKNDGSLRWS